MEEIGKIIVWIISFIVILKVFGRKHTPSRPTTKMYGKSDNSSCKYCGNQDYGSGCVFSPTGYHEHNDTSDHCEYCGSTDYGSGCNYNVAGNRKHKHGIGNNKCRWCGTTDNGSGCVFSPTGYHEK